MMENFTPVSGLLGGMLIGLATVLLMLFNGRIAGISGIVSGLLARQGSEVAWRVLFAAGLLLGPFIYILARGEVFPVEIQASLPVMVIAGLLVGFGTRLGSGCTSGHGVSGISRLSRRSIVATTVFIGSAIITVFVTGQVL
ncbi:MAG: YeeE/YedE family protein [Rubrobacteraceae bacterium]